jgi:putative SOS response-associated peptidase YedK
MCERYALPAQVAAEREFTPDQVWWKFAARFNVAAQQYAPAIRLHQGQSEAVMMRWGLIPGWAEGKFDGEPPQRIAVGQVEGSTAHREAWMAGRRCILPVAGYYLWQLTAARYRQPYFVQLSDRSVFGLAGVWDRSVGEDDDVIESFSVICVPANELMRRVASAEPLMPAILKRRDYNIWLRGTPAEGKSVLHAYRSDGMQAHAVSPRVNSAAMDDAGLIRPTRLRPLVTV